jgi:cobaltochelatase CobT
MIRSLQFNSIDDVDITGLRRASQAVVQALAPHRKLDGIEELLKKAPRHASTAQLAAWRGRVDAFAFRLRYCDELLHARLRPAGAAARKLYALLEQSRVEALGSRLFLGTAKNLVAHDRESGLPTEPGLGLADIELIAFVVREVRTRIGAPISKEGIGAPAEGATDPPVSRASIEAHLTALAAAVGNQEAFAKESLRLITRVSSSCAEAPQRQTTYAHDSAEKSASELRRSSAVSTGVGGEQKRTQQRSISGLRDEEGGARSYAEARETPRYRAYTKEFDWVGHARELYSAEELLKYRRILDRCVAERVGDAQRWAHRLQRHLVSRRLSSWQFDLEEGLLDCARLYRVVTSPAESLSFKQEATSHFPDTAVTVLVDNSGSMRGTSIEIAAVCADLLGGVFERCGVKFEILGFTTRAWRGGRSRQQWVEAGRPASPGRLTDLCHVVYKSMDDPWRRARLVLGAMLQPVILKENVDGEALWWAHERLLARREARRILLVVSDGAPRDDSTLDANDRDYLDRHLRQVIATIERSSPIELDAIGIGHDVTGYYARSLTLSRPEELGKAMYMRLAELLDSHSRSSRGIRRQLA